jgi:hypothetical protein
MTEVGTLPRSVLIKQPTKSPFSPTHHPSVLFEDWTLLHGHTISEPTCRRAPTYCLNSSENLKFFLKLAENFRKLKNFCHF